MTDRRSSFDQASAGFRAHLPDLSSPRFTTAAKQNIYEYVRSMQDNRAPPWLYDLTKVWEKLLEEPYTGVTNDGKVRPGLFHARDEGADVQGAVAKAEELLKGLDDEKKKKLSYPINAREWRAWSNPEFLLRPFGLRLEEGNMSAKEKPQRHANLLSTGHDRAGNTRRGRSVPVTGRLPKGTVRYAHQSFPGGGGQTSKHHEQVLLQLPVVWNTLYIREFTMGLATIRPPPRHRMLLQGVSGRAKSVLHWR